LPGLTWMLPQRPVTSPSVCTLELKTRELHGYTMSLHDVKAMVFGNVGIVTGALAAPYMFKESHMRFRP
jgi:hypothetical protein